MVGRKPGRLYADILERVHDVIKRFSGASINEISKYGNIGWGTAERYADALEEQHLITHRLAGNRRVYFHIMGENKEEKP